LRRCVALPEVHHNAGDWPIRATGFSHHDGQLAHAARGKGRVGIARCTPDGAGARGGRGLRGRSAGAECRRAQDGRYGCHSCAHVACLRSSCRAEFSRASSSMPRADCGTLLRTSWRVQSRGGRLVYGGVRGRRRRFATLRGPSTRRFAARSGRGECRNARHAVSPRALPSPHAHRRHPRITVTASPPSPPSPPPRSRSTARTP
jgi:hypothetical protein